MVADANGVQYLADRKPPHSGGDARGRGEHPRGQRRCGVGQRHWKPASFNYPTGRQPPRLGRHLVAEAYNLRIRRLSLSGAAAMLAGSGTGAWTDGQGTLANFYPAVVEHLKHHARHPGH